MKDILGLKQILWKLKSKQEFYKQCTSGDNRIKNDNENYRKKNKNFDNKLGIKLSEIISTFEEKMKNRLEKSAFDYAMSVGGELTKDPQIDMLKRKV